MGCISASQALCRGLIMEYCTRSADKALELFGSVYGHSPDAGFCACGRTELLGNHTDHQHGMVLASAVDLCTAARVSLNNDGIIRIASDGFGLCSVDVSDLSARPQERGTTASLVRGIAAGFADMGRSVGGFDAAVASDLLPGGGLSSSAAFEVLVAVIINDLFNGSALDPVDIAKLSQRAENDYFGKPCGLMDQMASALGGIISIDFSDAADPKVERLDFDLHKSGYDLCIIDTRSSHADLNSEYSSITAELASVCSYFNKKYLREVPEALFFDNISSVRSACGDRAVMRAMHVYAENSRVEAAVSALKSGDFRRYLELVNESGDSSCRLMQNVVPAGAVKEQSAAITLAVARSILGGRGACRIHGGGFGGTIQAFVPSDVLQGFVSEMERICGAGICLNVRLGMPGGRRFE